MKNPKWLSAAVIFIALLCISTVVGYLKYDLCLLNLATTITGMLTLAVLLIYAFHTYLIAKEAWTPSASFSIVPYSNNPHYFTFNINNHSKMSLQCWCNLNVSVLGQSIKMNGFYGGESSFDMQPFGTMHGVFNIVDILKKANRTVAEMTSKTSSTIITQQLRLDIDFWYNIPGSNSNIHNAKQPHYFDFSNNAMVTDF